MTSEPVADGNHPSPHKREVKVASLLYGLIAAPVAWVASQIANSTLAQEACFPKREPLLQPAFSVTGLQIALLGLSLAVCASAALVAYRNWRNTRREGDGDAHALLEIGEGRSRFMALAGMLTSLGFMLATLFSAPAVVFVPAC